MAGLRYTVDSPMGRTLAAHRVVTGGDLTALADRYSHTRRDCTHPDAVALLPAAAGGCPVQIVDAGQCWMTLPLDGRDPR